jgi:hypothetical protein
LARDADERRRDDPGRAHDSLFTARVDPATKARVGEPLELTLDPAKFHFFDVETGRSLLLADAGREAAHEEALS